MPLAQSLNYSGLLSNHVLRLQPKAAVELIGVRRRFVICAGDL